MFFAVVMLTCLVAAAGWCLITRTRLAAWLLLGFSALWLPANNGQLEGHILITLSPRHGFTEGDGVGVIGWLLAMTVLLVDAVRGEPPQVRSERIGAVVLVGLAALAFGALAAYETS